jgi:hypothetical protein
MCYGNVWLNMGDNRRGVRGRHIVAVTMSVLWLKLSRKVV